MRPGDEDRSLPGLPIFPLRTVLAPGSVLPLRVFETRYVDMVRDCLKTATGFGVCAIRHGHETGAPASHAPVGCLARIESFDMNTVGVFEIAAVGHQRFRIERAWVQGDGLARADVVVLPDDPQRPVPADCDGARALLRGIVESGGIDRPDAVPVALRTPLMFRPPLRYDDAGWLANRWLDLLPLELPQRERLMMLSDPVARLRAIQSLIDTLTARPDPSTR